MFSHRQNDASAPDRPSGWTTPASDSRRPVSGLQRVLQALAINPPLDPAEPRLSGLLRALATTIGARAAWLTLAAPDATGAGTSATPVARWPEPPPEAWQRAAEDNLRVRTAPAPGALVVSWGEAFRARFPALAADPTLGGGVELACGAGEAATGGALTLVFGPADTPEEETLDLVRIAAAALGRELADMRARRAQREDRAELQAIFTHTHAGVVVLRRLATGDFVHERINPQGERETGLSAHLLTGRSLSEALPAAMAAFIGEQSARALLVGQAVQATQRFDLPAGERSAQLTFVPLPGGTDGPDRVVVLGHDLTEARRQQLVFDQTQALAKVGGWEIDYQTQTLTWTRETFRLHEVDPATYTPRLDTAFDFFTGSDRERLRAAVSKALADRTGYDLRVQLVTARGNRRDVRAVAQVEARQGASVRVWGAIQDLTELTQAEQEIRQLNADLERRVAERTTLLAAANQELEAFSYSVSHDLRSPLRAIDGFSRALEEDYKQLLDDEGRDYLRRIRAGSQRMGLLIDDLLRLSRASRGDLSRTRVDVSAMVAEIVAYLRESQPQRTVTFTCAENLVAEADPNLLRLVWENLLDNAWKYSRRQPVAVIEVGVLPDPQGAGPAYFVRDNGTGFEMRHAHKLFGAFQRLHGREEFEGTGIGLATVRRIINRHGGRTWGEGAPHQGATFYFTLGHQSAGA